jgi:hypothetical protein
MPGWRGVEQTPETAFVLGAALRAYPHGKAVHIVRDGRDVICSLLERGWMSAGRAGCDDVRLAYGSWARFWVEPGRIARVRGSEQRDARRLGLALAPGRPVVRRLAADRGDLSRNLGLRPADGSPAQTNLNTAVTNGKITQA